MNTRPVTMPWAWEEREMSFALKQLHCGFDNNATLYLYTTWQSTCMHVMICTHFPHIPLLCAVSLLIALYSVQCPSTLL